MTWILFMDRLFHYHKIKWYIHKVILLLVMVITRRYMP